MESTVDRPPMEHLRSRVLAAALELVAEGKRVSPGNLRTKGVRGNTNLLILARDDLIAAGALPPGIVRSYERLHPKEATGTPRVNKWERILAVAAQFYEPGETASPTEIARVLGMTRQTVGAYITDLKRRNLWPYAGIGTGKYVRCHRAQERKREDGGRKTEDGEEFLPSSVFHPPSSREAGDVIQDAPLGATTQALPSRKTPGKAARRTRRWVKEYGVERLRREYRR